MAFVCTHSKYSILCVCPMLIHVLYIQYMYVYDAPDMLYMQGLVYKVESFRPDEKAWLGCAEVNTVQIHAWMYTCT